MVLGRELISTHSDHPFKGVILSVLWFEKHTDD